MCLNTVIDQSRGIGQCYILSGKIIWRETAERNFGFLTMMLKIVPKFLSAVSCRKLIYGLYEVYLTLLQTLPTLSYRRPKFRQSWYQIPASCANFAELRI
jgi:hypothetical protein